jgi:DNA-binding XRE family transcriptional regulator
VAPELESCDFEELLCKARSFAELMGVYLQSSPKLREAIIDMVELAQDEATGPADRDRAYATIASALLASTNAEAWAAGVRESREPLSAEKKAALDSQQAVFGERLREQRMARRLTQAELAERVGVGQSAISTMEDGKCCPQGTTLAKLAAALGVEKNDLWPAARPARAANGAPAARREAQDGARSMPR